MRKILFIVLIIILGVSSFAYFRTTLNKQPVTPTNLLDSIFPIGKEVGEDAITQNNSTENFPVGDFISNNGTVITNQNASILSSGPAAGFTVFQKKMPDNTLVDIVWYVSRETGFVYEAEGTSLLQISNIKIPNIYEAVFVEGGKSVILRYIKGDGKTIGSYYVPIPEPDSSGIRTQKPGKHLPDNILSLVSFADGKQIATLTDEKGETIIRTASPSYEKPVPYFSYQFKDWLLVASRTTLYLQTKAHSSFAGSLFKLGKGIYEKIASGGMGLTAGVSPSGEYLLLSNTTQTGFTGILTSIKSGAQKTIQLPILPEKCTWIALDNLLCGIPQNLPEGRYPEDWYMGRTQFSDSVVLIQAQNGSFEVKETTSYDITQPNYSDTTKTLYFIDKKTGTLFRLKV